MGKAQVNDVSGNSAYKSAEKWGLVGEREMYVYANLMLL